MFISLSNFTTGFAVGYGFGFFTREIVRAGDSVLRPVATSAIRTTAAAIERGKESVAHFGESLEDLVAEARAKESSTSRASRASTPKKKKATAKKTASGRKKKAAS